MLKREREITDVKEIRKILDTGEVIRLGIHDGEEIYILPMNYGYEMDEKGKPIFYLHSGRRGKKLELLKENGRVAFELDGEHQLLEGQVPCQYGYAYSSIIGRGQAEIVTEPKEKIRGMEILMKSLTGKEFTFNEKLVSIVEVIRLTVTEYSAKRRPVRLTTHETEHEI